MALPWADPLLCNAPAGTLLGIQAGNVNVWPFLDLWHADAALNLTNGAQCKVHLVTKPPAGDANYNDPVHYKHHLDLCPHSAPSDGMFHVRGDELRSGMFSLSSAAPAPCSFCATKQLVGVKEFCRRRFPDDVEKKVGIFLSHKLARAARLQEPDP